MIRKSLFGELSNGEKACAYTLETQSGMSIEVLSYGGIISKVLLPTSKAGKAGEKVNVVLSFDNLEDYLKEHPYFGAIIGRCGNRIAHGKFVLHGKEYHLTTNHYTHHLHGGAIGFDKVSWQVEPREVKSGNFWSPQLVLRYLSRDGEEGYPGNLSVEVTYTLTHNALEVSYRATTDRPTIVNLTQHSYFNLSGNPRQTVLDHLLKINADYMLPVNHETIPTGEFMPVSSTPFDFTRLKPIGQNLGKPHPQLLRVGGGYDHCYSLNSKNSFAEAAHVVHPASGRCLTVYTSGPGVQLYTANHLKSPFVRHGGLCLETQHFPDSPNHPDFPSVTLSPGKVYTSQTHYQFGYVE